MAANSNAKRPRNNDSVNNDRLMKLGRLRDSCEIQKRLDDDDQVDELSDSYSLIDVIGRDLSIECLIRCSRSDYQFIASLNKSFRSLIRSSEIYRLRRQQGTIEHWLYFSLCRRGHIWEAFDPVNNKWTRLPKMTPKKDFSFRKCLAVGTELLVFGLHLDGQPSSPVMYGYDISTNLWSFGKIMNAPRTMFASASLGSIAIIAGGSNCESPWNTLTSAEMYDSESQTWETLPCMNKPRQMGSAVFMDGKFYIIGGCGRDDELLTCGEEFNLKTNKWTHIPNMSPVLNTGPFRDIGFQPFVAVVDDELYAADCDEEVVKRYDKKRNLWTTVGKFPKSAVSTEYWILVWIACGHHLIMVIRSFSHVESFIEINSWVPTEAPSYWNLLDVKRWHGTFDSGKAISLGC